MIAMPNSHLVLHKETLKHGGLRKLNLLSFIHYNLIN